MNRKHLYPNLNIQQIDDYFVIKDERGDFYAKAYYEADAQLVAAVLDLFRAAEKALFAIESYNSVMTDEIAVALADAKWSIQAAAAKATGGAA
jgi:hypothetical protein